MFTFTDISTYHSQLNNDETNCVSVVEHYLEKISEKSQLNAFVEVYAGEALEKAKHLDNARKNGEPLKKLHGVIIAIKDVICYKGHKVSASSKILQNFYSLYTATALQLLLDEDAIIIGNCNCDEFAMGSSNENSFYGKVLNDADHSRVPGGSSGGSAVAVQAGLCMLSLGSDTGGSVRQPAGFCGITGFKPGYGTYSRYGLIAYASSFDQIGIFGNNIKDIALLHSIMAKHDHMDSTMHQSPVKKEVPEKFRFCYFRQMLEHPALDAEIAESFRRKIQEIKKQGHEVFESEFPLLEYIVPAYYILTTAEASSNLSRYDGIRYGYTSAKPAGDLFEFYCNNRSEGFGWEVKRRIMLGSFVLSAGYFDAYYQKALQVRKMVQSHVLNILADHHAILTPVSPSVAFKFNDSKEDPVSMYLADIYTVLANLTGIAGISLPLFSHSSGMPAGMQVMANNRDEVSLLHISEWLSKHI